MFTVHTAGNTAGNTAHHAISVLHRPNEHYSNTEYVQSIFFSTEACGMVRPQYILFTNDDPVPPPLPTSCYCHPQNMFHELLHILQEQYHPFRSSLVAVSTSRILGHSSETMCWYIYMFHVLTTLRDLIQVCCHITLQHTVTPLKLDTNHTPVHSITFRITSCHAIP